MYFVVLKLFSFNCYLDSKLQFLYFIVSLLNVTHLNYLFIITIFLFIFKYNYKIYNSFIVYNLFIIILKKKKYFLISNKLLIGLNNIHPFIFYFSIILFGLLILKKISLISNNIFLIFYSSCISLILGGFWGSGNSLWGFFWVSDKIEIILLYYCLLILFFLHIYNNNNLNYIFFLTFFIVVLNIYLLRSGFSFTRHNFFDLKKTINIFLFYSFLYFNCYILIFILKINIILFYFIFCFYITKLNLKLNIYNFFLIILHICIGILFIIWLKNKIYNYVIFFNNFKYFTITNYIYNYSLITSNYLYFNSNFLNIFKLKLIFLYTIKFIICLKQIIMSYNLYIILLFSLISIIKIQRYK